MPDPIIQPTRPGGVTPMSIRFRLILLTAAVLLPSVVGSLVAMGYLYRERVHSVERSLHEMSRALSLVVDSKMDRRKSLLTMLGASPSLARGDFDTFRQEMQTAARVSEAAFFLYDEDGKPIIGTDDLLNATIPPEAMAGAVIGQRGNFVSDTYAAPDGVASYAVIRAVAVGQSRYQLGTIVDIAQFQKVFADLDMPAQWTGVILDRKGIIVARNRDPHLHVRHIAHPDILENLSGSHGVFRSLTREGIPSFTAFNTAQSAGWSFLIAIPEAEVTQSAVGGLKMLLIFSLALIGLATLLSVRVGRRIVAPMRILTAQAEALGRNESIDEVATGLRETDVVSHSMAQARIQIRDSKRIMEQRVAEAVAQTHRSQQVLLQSQKLEALGRLTGGIAHDFNNLLQTLSTGLHVVELLNPNSDAKPALDSCTRAVGRATKLTRQLMAFGKSHVSEAKRMDIRNQLLAMEDLLTGALRSDIVLRLELEEHLWPVHTDQLQFELAILNLAINSRDAIHGRGNVCISAENVAIRGGDHSALGEGDYVEISFSDDGDGMPPEVLQKALDPFFTTKSAGKGSGLGLAQVYGFVKQSDGGITLESALGKGTTVTFFLPRSLADVSHDPEPSAPPATATGPAATVLFVEDDVLVRDVVAPALRSHGFRVITAGDADEALDILPKHSIEIVFSDVVMPGSMNGVKLAEVIRAQFPAMPVVLASGYSEETHIPDGIHLIAKPYQIATVVSALREALACGDPP